jgi:hypothetical protein
MSRNTFLSRLTGEIVSDVSADAIALAQVLGETEVRPLNLLLNPILLSGEAWERPVIPLDAVS